MVVHTPSTVCVNPFRRYHHDFDFVPGRPVISPFDFDRLDSASFPLLLVFRLHFSVHGVTFCNHSPARFRVSHASLSFSGIPVTHHAIHFVVFRLPLTCQMVLLTLEHRSREWMRLPYWCLLLLRLRNLFDLLDILLCRLLRWLASVDRAVVLERYLLHQCQLQN